MQGDGGNKKSFFQNCTDSSKKEFLLSPSSLRLFGTQSHCYTADNVLIPNNFFEYIYHIGCAISLHSITNSGLIPEGQNSSRKRQTVFFTSVDPMNKEHRDLNTFDLEASRLAWYKQKTWKKHQNTVCWVEKQLAQREGFKFYQTRCNAILLYDTLPAYCIFESCCDEI